MSCMWSSSGHSARRSKSALSKSSTGSSDLPSTLSENVGLTEFQASGVRATFSFMSLATGAARLGRRQPRIGSSAGSPDAATPAHSKARRQSAAQEVSLRVSPSPWRSTKASARPEAASRRRPTSGSKGPSTLMGAGRSSRSRSRWCSDSAIASLWQLPSWYFVKRWPKNVVPDSQCCTNRCNALLSRGVKAAAGNAARGANCPSAYSVGMPRCSRQNPKVGAPTSRHQTAAVYSMHCARSDNPSASARLRQPRQ
mmetsp:Transcript_3483/g.10134  ORF Transcript_3483/g.10134 Transcript_3483/m.10134 type:complete len:255 (-) Transcript_3483:511-1275(-)